MAEGDTDETAEKKRLRLKERREELIKHRETLDETGRESANAFDKTLLSLSGGALFLSLTFVKEIAKHPTMTSRAFLVLGWALFILSLTFVLLAMLATQYAARDEIKKVDHELNPEEADLSPGTDPMKWWWPSHWTATFAGYRNNPGDRVDLHNNRAVYTFFLGVVMVVFCCVSNFVFGAAQ